MSNVHPIPPVVRTIRVARSPADAFRLFTDEIGLWWPLPTHSLGGAGGSVAVEVRPGGDIVETTADGTRHVWGSVTEAMPGVRLAFTWHVGRPPAEAGLVEVNFTPDGEATIVDLIHTGWERMAGPSARQVRDGYNTGWVDVFERRYGEHAGIAAAGRS